ncbi:very short patch repair endonuclease [Cellulomonas cellasea]|uniref:DNA mismatch repair protein n=2 Tax=Cellulomonas cellasea TaxID=43670 RepID=A0A0A0BET1_9CELL|nr:very short patch repair endonuclease [Cellulomonas cellasea]KGM03841.1 DNA mismatch repair protein [Cellulomonas cellasea DSM 20118]
METNAATSSRMARVRNRDTAAELAVRRELHKRGRRYFVQRAVLPGRRRVDVVFPGPKIAVFIDGCFWHSCPQHATRPKANAEWWAEKLARNVARDRQSDADLAAAGWQVMRIWEHVPASAAADMIEAALDNVRAD